MVTVGIDVGAKYVKIAVLRDGQILARKKREGGFEQGKVAGELLKEAITGADIPEEEISKFCSTGAGRRVIANVVKNGLESVTEVTAVSRATHELYPEVRTVIDVGAEEGRAIRCDSSGKVEDFAINEKCAAGSGAFTAVSYTHLTLPTNREV